MFNGVMFAIFTNARKYILRVCGVFHPYSHRRVRGEAVVYTHKCLLHVLVSLSSIHNLYRIKKEKKMHLQ